MTARAAVRREWWGGLWGGKSGTDSEAGRAGPGGPFEQTAWSSVMVTYHDHVPWLMVTYYGHGSWQLCGGPAQLCGGPC
jgi:hypothetical protein